jgi:hypothetical protein
MGIMELDGWRVVRELAIFWNVLLDIVLGEVAGDWFIVVRVFLLSIDFLSSLWRAHFRDRGKGKLDLYACLYCTY